MFTILMYKFLKSRRLVLYKKMLENSGNFYLCPRLVKCTNQSLTLCETVQFVNCCLPELKQACEESPYFTSFYNWFWFRDCPPYKNQLRRDAERAIRDAVLTEAIKKCL